MSITKTSDQTYTEGLRFYRPHPYLLVTKTADKGLAAQMVYLPDKTQEYVIKQHAGIGSSDLTVTLENGWNVTALGHKLDTKVPEMLTAITGMAKLATGDENPNKPAAQDSVGLYRIEYDSKGEKVIGLNKVGP